LTAGRPQDLHFGKRQVIGPTQLHPHVAPRPVDRQHRGRARYAGSEGVGYAGLIERRRQIRRVKRTIRDKNIEGTQAVPAAVRPVPQLHSLKRRHHPQVDLPPRMHVRLRGGHRPVRPLTAGVAVHRVTRISTRIRTRLRHRLAQRKVGRPDHRRGRGRRHRGRRRRWLTAGRPQDLHFGKRQVIGPTQLHPHVAPRPVDRQRRGRARYAGSEVVGYPGLIDRRRQIRRVKRTIRDKNIEGT
jgi:hypothetical protein